MEIVGLFFGLIGLNNRQSIKVEIQKEIDIADAVKAHVNWKVRLRRYMDGESNEQLRVEDVCRDDNCILGKWIYGPGSKHFHGNEHFKRLQADHTRFHSLAGTIVARMQGGEKEKAEELFANEYSRSSFRVIKSLTTLNKELNNEG